MAEASFLASTNCSPLIAEEVFFTLRYICKQLSTRIQRMNIFLSNDKCKNSMNLQFYGKLAISQSRLHKKKVFAR